MKIITTPLEAKDLKPGDLFSTLGAEYWDNVNERPCGNGEWPVGERVYIRTNEPTPLAQQDQPIYLITIERDSE